MTSATIGQPAKSDKERLIGTWTLVSLTSGVGANQTSLRSQSKRHDDGGCQW